MPAPNTLAHIDNKRAGKNLKTWRCRWNAAQKCWLEPSKPRDTGHCVDRQRSLDHKEITI